MKPASSGWRVVRPAADGGAQGHPSARPPDLTPAPDAPAPAGAGPADTGSSRPPERRINGGTATPCRKIEAATYVSPGVHLLPGEYRFTRFRSNLLSTAAKRRLSGSINMTYGNYWSGRAEQLTTSLTYKLPPRFTVGVSTNQTFARLPEGHFIARIFTSSVSYAASPLLSLSNLVQYDNRSRNLGWQSRVR